MDKIVVLDFGSQYSHLICRRIREFSVYAELVPFDITVEELTKLNPKGIIFSGGPASVYNSGAPIPENKIFEMKLPILGICYGHQLIVNNYGGKVKRVNKEYGSSLLTIDDDSNLLSGLGKSIRAWMSHGDEAEQIPKNFEVIGHTESAKAAAIANMEKSVYGIQFHPEVVHTEQGTEILKNFVLKICKAKQEWTMKGFVEKTVKNISKIDEKKQFLTKLDGVSDPEKKRKIVGEEFVRIFTEFAEKNGPFRWLAQGTLYPDVIESGVSKGPASVIKTHHNVGGLPDWLKLEILEPLRDLYKDEVRKVAKILEIPQKLLMRHPFPGP